MRVGIFAPLLTPTATAEYLSALAEGVEALGFESLWVAEHVVAFDDYRSRYPYAADGRMPAPSHMGLLEPFAALHFLAARTRKVRLGTGICLVPQRNPVYTAKQVATLDWLSGGRFDFGVGVGWLAEEFEAVGVPFTRRGARCRSYLEVMKRLWSDEPAAYEDEFYRLPPCRLHPKPLQRPHPPIHFGGESEAALRRAVDLGQGWFGNGLSPEAAAGRIDRLRKLLAASGRSQAGFEISVSPYTRSCDAQALRRYAEAGVDRVIVLAFAPDPDQLRTTLERLAAELLAAAQGLATPT